MANKKFKGGTACEKGTPVSTPDAGNKPNTNDNHLIAKAPKGETMYKKIPELQRGKGTWGGGVSRP